MRPEAILAQVEGRHDKACGGRHRQAQEMKTLAVVLLFFASAQAQPWGRFNWIQERGWESRWVVSVVNKGDTTCAHQWVEKPEQITGLWVSCLAVHDSRGCPRNWGERTQICRLCLRKEEYQEERYFTQAEIDREKAERNLVDEYNRLDKRIGKK